MTTASRTEQERENRQKMEAEFAHARSMIGIEVTQDDPWPPTEASRDNIRRFVHCMADPNPLYQDEEYARKSHYGRLVAPPNFLFAVGWASGTSGPGGGRPNWATVGLYAGTECEWYRPVLLGDTFTVTRKQVTVTEKVGRTMGRAHLFQADTKIRNQRGEMVAKFRGSMFSAEQRAVLDGRKRRPVYKYSEAELKRIAQAYRTEEASIRGSKPRYWEDVRAGDELTPLARGPLTREDMVAWVAGASIPAEPYGRWVTGLNWRDLEKLHGKVYPRDWATTPEYYLRVPEAERRTGNSTHHITAQESDKGDFGVGHAYAQQRASWVPMLFTHWMGDTGFLKRMNMQQRAVHQLGDTLFLRGRVLSKEVVDGEHLVHIEIIGENQLGEVSTPGSGTVVLPSKG